MSRYLARLKSEKQPTNELQKVQKGVFTVFAVPSGDVFEKNTAAQDRRATTSEEPTIYPLGHGACIDMTGTGNLSALFRAKTLSRQKHAGDDLQKLQKAPDRYQAELAEESSRRFDFCETHRQMIGGTCERFDVIERLTHGDQAKALDACLLWQLVCCGEKIERAAPSEIVGGVTVGDVLRWVSVNGKDLEAIRKERRLLLTCAEALQGAGHFWEN